MVHTSTASLHPWSYLPRRPCTAYLKSSANNPGTAAGQFADAEACAAPLPLQASNAAYQSKLGCRPGGKEAMAAIGFK